MFQLKVLFTTFLIVYLSQVKAYRSYRYKEVVTRIDGGWIQGTVRTADGNVDYYSFRGIRYAKPPIGSRRFAPLQPIDAWDGMYDASEEGPVCPQKDLYYGRLLNNAQGQNEDCMFVNVHVPATAELSNGTTTRKCNLLPIVVVINEGGFQSGSGNSDFHGPEHLMRHNVVVVTANTRIGLFGYLSLNIPEVPGNNGLRDWITVLRWLQKNAEAFGGDPNNVTLMGLSTGAVIAHLLAISPAAPDLFHKLYLSSGSAIDKPHSMSPEYAANLANDLRNALSGCSNDPYEFYQQLIEMDLSILMSAFSEVQLHDIVSFAPVIEERFDDVEIIVDQDSIKSLVEGRDIIYPTIFIETDNEMQFVKPLPRVQALPSILEENPTAIFSNGLKYNLTDERLQDSAHKVFNKYFSEYFKLDDVIDVLSKEYFHYPNRKYAQLRARLGGAPMYMGRFGYEADFSVVKEGTYLNASGAVHCEDQTYILKSYLLGTYDSYPPIRRDDHMRNMMTTILTNFMKCGNPTCSEDYYSEWPPVKLNDMQYLQILEPYVYTMTYFTPEDLDLIGFYDQIETRLSDAVNNVSCNE